MEVTLKKASALALALAGTSIPITHTMAVDPYGDAPKKKEVEALTETLAESIKAQMLITSAVYVIRHEISQANAPRITTLLTARAELTKHLAFLNAIPRRPTAPNLDVLARKLEAVRATPQPGYSNRPVGVALELETSALVDPLLKEMKRKLRNIEDELASLNHSTKIKLPDDVVKLLTELDLI